MTKPTHRTRPSAATREAERAEMKAKHESDSAPTPQEENALTNHTHVVDPEVARHEEEMLTRGASQRGEGRLP
jgi:hypothetical protein